MLHEIHFLMLLALDFQKRHLHIHLILRTVNESTTRVELALFGSVVWQLSQCMCAKLNVGSIVWCAALVCSPSVRPAHYWILSRHGEQNNLERRPLQKPQRLGHWKCHEAKVSFYFGSLEERYDRHNKEHGAIARSTFWTADNRSGTLLALVAAAIQSAMCT